MKTIKPTGELYVQVGLRNKDTELVCNLPYHYMMKPGAWLTLRDDDRRWTIEWVSDHKKDKSLLDTVR